MNNWYVTINPDHPESFKVIEEAGLEGYGYLCIILKHWQDIGEFELTERLFCYLCKTKPQKAKRLLPVFKESLRSLQGVLKESCKSLQGVFKDSTPETLVPVSKKEEKRKEEKERKTPQTPQGGSVRFEEFWSTYPKKTGKTLVKSIWERKNLDNLADEIITAVKRYIQTKDWQEEDGKYIPNPSTFLNQGRWEDEIPAPAPPKVEYQPW